MKRYLLAIALLASTNVWGAEGVALTVYNDNLGLVKQTRTLDFAKGVGEIRFDDVAAMIDPTSVHISLKEEGISILEQNYQYDLVNTQKIMQKYLGREIAVMTKGGLMHRGDLLSFDGKFAILKGKTGEITVTNSDEIVDYNFEALPEGLILKPTLVWLADSDRKQKSECEVSYLTDGLNWHAEYVAVVDKADENLDLSGWVSIENTSGATYKDAVLKLVAGKVHRVTAPPMMPPLSMRSAKAEMAPQFEEEAFFEYHVYSLKRPATVADNEVKQVSLFPETRASVKKVFTVESQYYWRGGLDDKPKVRVNLEFTNSKARGLGMPLPKGKLRVYKADSEGSLQFVGEDSIDHTPENEKVRVFLGEAFDLVCERKKTDVVDLGGDHKRETYQITLRNHKDENITVTVIEPTPGWREWRITRSDVEYNKVSVYRVEFPVAVAAGGETDLRYTIEY